MTAALLEHRPARLRWGLSAAMVALAHVAAAGAMLRWAEAPPPSPPPAMMIELAPMPAAPPPAPPAVRPPPPPEPIPEIAPAPVKPPVALPKPPPKKPPPRRKKVERELPKPPQPQVQAPPQPTPTPAPPQPAPSRTVQAPPPGAAAARLAQAMPSFQQRLLAHLERHKRYPLRARQRRETGVVYLRFVMNRAGKVLSARIERSAGHAALDEEVQAMIERAQPLPTPPEDLPEPVELVVPVRFSLR